VTEEEDLKERQRLYERTRDELAANGRSMSETYDRALLTLSSAFLGGSLAFIGEVVKLQSASWKWILYSSWLLFALTIILTVASFIYGLQSLQPLRDAAERYYIQRDLEAWKVSLSVQRSVLRFARSAGVSFILGVVLLSTFVFTNLARGPVMAEESSAPEILKRSIPPATFQKPVTPAPASGSGTPETPVQAPATQTTQQKQGS